MEKGNENAFPKTQKIKFLNDAQCGIDQQHGHHDHDHAVSCENLATMGDSEGYDPCDPGENAMVIEHGIP